MIPAKTSAAFAAKAKKAKPALNLTDEEIAYLKEKLDGVNHPIGQDILKKLGGGE